MPQTYGSQVFGSMYDIAVSVIISIAFVYFGVRARGMTPDERAKMPLIIGNWKACFSFAVVSALLAFAKCVHS